MLNFTFHCIAFYFPVSHHNLGLTQLLRPARRRLDRFVHNLLEPGLLKAHQRRVCCAVGAGDVLSELAGLLGGLDQHLAGAHARLLGQSVGLFGGEAELDGAGDEVLDHGEEVCGAGT